MNLINDTKIQPSVTIKTLITIAIATFSFTVSPLNEKIILSVDVIAS